MKKTIILGTFLFLSVFGISQDIVYGSFLNDQKSWLQQINSNPTNGSSGSFTFIKNEIIRTAALGSCKINNQDWLVYLSYNTSDKFSIYVISTSGGAQYKIADNQDLTPFFWWDFNQHDLDYVRLGFDKHGIGYIIAKEKDTPNIYAGSFVWNGSVSSPIVVVTPRGKLNAPGFNNSFMNGDLAIDGTGMLYVLANKTNEETQIFTIHTTTLLSTNSNSTNTLMNRWNIKNSSGNNFTGRVNGFAFASGGSAYLSTDDGYYFLDQNSTNFVGGGTVLCTKILNKSNLSDLSTFYWPNNTAFPVRFGKTKIKIFFNNKLH